jgi:hypothetical protein
MAQPNCADGIDDLGALDGIDWALTQRWEGLITDLLKDLAAIVII